LRSRRKIKRILIPTGASPRANLVANSRRIARSACLRSEGESEQHSQPRIFCERYEFPRLTLMASLRRASYPFRVANSDGSRGPSHLISAGTFFSLAVLCLLDTTVLLSCLVFSAQSAFESFSDHHGPVGAPMPQPEIAPENTWRDHLLRRVSSSPQTGAANPGKPLTHDRIKAASCGGSSRHTQTIGSP